MPGGMAGFIYSKTMKFLLHAQNLWEKNPDNNHFLEVYILMSTSL